MQHFLNDFATIDSGMAIHDCKHVVHRRLLQVAANTTFPLALKPLSDLFLKGRPLWFATRASITGGRFQRQQLRLVFSPCSNERLANSEMTASSAIAFLSTKLYNFQFETSLVALATVHVWNDKTWERLRWSWSELGQQQNETTIRAASCDCLKRCTWRRLACWHTITPNQVENQKQNETKFIVHSVHHSARSAPYMVYALHRFQGCVFIFGV